MKLKSKKTAINEVDYKELEVFATKIYNLKNYSFVAIEEGQNDSSYPFTVDGEIDELDQIYVDLIKNDGRVPSYNNGILLNLLCKEGHIDKGEYLINVCW